MIYATTTIYPAYPNANYWANTIYNFIHPYDSRLTHTADTPTIDFDNKFSLVFSVGSSYVSLKMVRPDNTEQDFGRIGYYAAGRNTTLSIVITDVAFYLRIMKVGAPTEGHASFSWLISGEKNFVTVSTADNPYLDANLTYYDTEDSTTYTLGKLFRFEVEALHLMYVDWVCLIATDSGKPYYIYEDMLSCSNVAYGSTITMNAKNYYAVGTNTLVYADNEE